MTSLAVAYGGAKLASSCFRLTPIIGSIEYGDKVELFSNLFGPGKGNAFLALWIRLAREGSICAIISMANLTCGVKGA
jgi:hypothetical protein